MAKTESETKGMMKDFLEGRELEIRVEKTKMLVFQKVRGRGKREEWRWGEEVIENAGELKYLCYHLRYDNKEVVQVKKLAKKRSKMLGQICEMGDFLEMISKGGLRV